MLLVLHAHKRWSLTIRETHDIIKDAWEQDAEIKYLDLREEKPANRTAEKIMRFIFISHHEGNKMTDEIEDACITQRTDDKFINTFS